MREFFELSNNPLFVKHVRTRLRRSALWPSVIIVVFLSMCIVFCDIYLEENRKAVNGQGENLNGGLQLFFWMQGIILVVIGGSQVALSITQMKETGIIDFHRITPMPPPVQTIGIMLGAPIREWILYAVTLPFAFFLALTGPIGALDFTKLLLVQLGGALMYYSFAMITGLAGGKPRGASGRFVGVVAGIYILASFCFSVHIYGPTLITSMPVYYEVFFENEAAQAEKQRQQQLQMQQQKQFAAANPGVVMPPAPPPEPRHEIKFFDVALPVVLQSLFFQSSILLFLFLAASRRIHSARRPLFRKSTAAAFLLTLSFLTIGSLWSEPTLVVTLLSVYFLMFCACALLNTTCPPLGEVVKGLQRAVRDGNQRPPVWSDLSTNKYLVGAFAIIVAAMASIAILGAPQPPLFGMFAVNAVFIPWLSILTGVLAILSYGFTRQYLALALGNRAKSYFVLYIFFLWIGPIVVGLLGDAAQIEGYRYPMMASPLVGVATSGLDDLPGVNTIAVKVASLAPVGLSALFFFGMLLVQEKRLSAVVRQERLNRPKHPEDYSADHVDHAGA